MASDQPDNARLHDLKDLLLEPERQRIAALEKRLDDPMTRAGEISRSLPDAIALSVMQDSRLSRVMQPVIDDSLKVSVRKKPKVMADAIFPALGPGIRKAISAAIMGMIQSLNQVLNHSVSVQGLKWRFEALRTGRPFAEVVLLHTLVYQVEQIFLIHSDTGIVLAHVTAEGMMVQDPDLVSGMFTAIQDFVRDSFGQDDASGEDLDTLRMGSDRSVWVERGEHALLAAVIRGTPPMELRTFYREIVEEVHLKAGEALAGFDGDTQPFALFRETLVAGLRFKAKTVQQKISPLAWLIVAALVGAMAGLPPYWWYTTRQADQEWADRLARLRNQKGVVVAAVDKAEGIYHISGLKDPLAPDPLAVLPEEARADIRATWQPFYSLDPEFILRRSQQILVPPPGVDLSFEQGRLQARGEAAQAWIRGAALRAAAIPGIAEVDFSGVANRDAKALDQAVAELMAQRLYFENNSTDLSPGQEQNIHRIRGLLGEIHKGVGITGKKIQVTIMGHTDSSGSETYNLMLSRERAGKIQDLVFPKDQPYAFINTTGVGTKIILKEEADEEDRRFNRAVTFQVETEAAPQGDPP